MSVQLGGWLALIGVFGTGLFSGFILGTDYYKWSNRKVICQISSVGLLLSGLACVAMIFQGFHLWNIGWDINLAERMDPSEAARLSARGRGRGGIFLMIFQFFPQFLVFGYGGWLWNGRHGFEFALKTLGIWKPSTD